MLRALPGLHGAVQLHEYGLTRRDVALEPVQRAFQGHRLAGQHHRAVSAPAHAQRTNAERIAKGQQAIAGNQCHHRIRALDALVHGAHGGKHVVRGQRCAAAGARQLVGQHVEQHLGVALGVGMAVVSLGQLAAQLLGVGQVAVVHHDDAERRVHVERLCLLLAGRAARGWVAHLAQAYAAGQRAHIARAEHVAHHALGLVHEELAPLLGDYASGILPPVLQQQQGVIDQLIHRGGADDADDSTHSSRSIFNGGRLPADNH